MKMFLASAVLTLVSVSVFAGGGGAGPEITYADLVHCRTSQSNAAGITELVYFQRTESQFKTSTEPGIYITGNRFSATVYSIDKNIHQITTAQNQPQAIHLAAEKVLALDYNIRALNVEARGETISLSMVAGATGHDIVQNLKMTCAAQ